MISYKEILDEKLMELYMNDDILAFNELYARHSSKVYSYLSKRVKDTGQVDEIFQNVFVKIHKSKNGYDSKYLFLKWLYTICRCEMIDFFKYKKAQFTQFNESVHLKESNELPSNRIDLDQVLELTDIEKKALNLKFYHDKDYEEICALLKIGRSNSRKIVSRAILKLRKKFVGGKACDK